MEQLEKTVQIMRDESPIWSRGGELTARTKDPLKAWPSVLLWFLTKYLAGVI